MLYIHRLIALIGGLILIYVIFTGLGTQLADMRALVMHAPASDPDMQMMRQHITGLNDFSVVSVPDYANPALPAGLDYNAALAKTAALGRAAVPGAAIGLVEVRTAEGRLAGHVRMGTQDLIFDLGSGARLPDADLPPGVPEDVPGSVRFFFKKFHQSRALGHFGTLLNAVAALAIFGLMITGLVQYFRLLKSRQAIGRNGPLWRSGGLWRDLHRAVAVIASLLVLYIAATGFALALDNSISSVRSLFAAPQSGPRQQTAMPISEADFPAWTQTTLASFAQKHPGVGIKVLRLRTYAGYVQGVIVAADEDTSQFVFNAKTGAPMSMTEPGYPDMGFPLGWEGHQMLKKLHRGDYFGMVGRWLVTLGGLALAYLIVSGIVMYAQAWGKRSKAGRKALVW